MYAIYLKCPNGRYHPIDLTTGYTVNRLLYASLWDSYQQAAKVLARLQALNTDACLQVRKVDK